MTRAVSYGLSPLEIEQKTAAVRESKDALDKGAREFVSTLRSTERCREQSDVARENQFF